MARQIDEFLKTPFRQADELAAKEAELAGIAIGSDEANEEEQLKVAEQPFEPYDAKTARETSQRGRGMRQ